MLQKIGNIVIFGPAFRFADMREPGVTKLWLHIGGDQFLTVDLAGEEDREFRQIWKDHERLEAMMASGGGEASRMEN